MRTVRGDPAWSRADRLPFLVRHYFFAVQQSGQEKIAVFCDPRLERVRVFGNVDRRAQKTERFLSGVEFDTACMHSRQFNCSCHFCLSLPESSLRCSQRKSLYQKYSVTHVTQKFLTDRSRSLRRHGTEVPVWSCEVRLRGLRRTGMQSVSGIASEGRSVPKTKHIQSGAECATSASRTGVLILGWRNARRIGVSTVGACVRTVR